jgi:hypothetical protein
VFLGFSIRQEPQFRKDTAPDRDQLCDSDLGGRRATELDHIPIRWIRAQDLTLRSPTNLPAQSQARGISPTHRDSTDLGRRRYWLNPTLQPRAALPLPLQLLIKPNIRCFAKRRASADGTTQGR